MHLCPYLDTMSFAQATTALQCLFNFTAQARASTSSCSGRFLTKQNEKKVLFAEVSLEVKEPQVIKTNVNLHICSAPHWPRAPWGHNNQSMKFPVKAHTTWKICKSAHIIGWYGPHNKHAFNSTIVKTPKKLVVTVGRGTRTEFCRSCSVFAHNTCYPANIQEQEVLR